MARAIWELSQKNENASEITFEISIITIPAAAIAEMNKVIIALFL